MSQIRDTHTENRLIQIIAEMNRLQASIDYNYGKFAFIIQRAFTENKRIEVSGQGRVNGMIWTWERAYVHTGLLFQDEDMVFVDDVKNVYSLEIGNITSIEIKEMEDGLPSQGCEAVSSADEARQNGGDRNTAGRKL